MKRKIPQLEDLPQVGFCLISTSWGIFLYSFILIAYEFKYRKIKSLWSSVKSRCLSKNPQVSKWWGLRGIKICDEWKDDFSVFYSWCIHNGWNNGLELDRRDNDGDYCPENCRFITRKENMNNTRTAINYRKAKDRFEIKSKNKRKVRF